RATFGLLAAGAATLIARPALAREPEVFQSGGVTINGTDPVAYFTQSLPVAGSSDYTVEWNGATWQFSSAENAATFAADPMTYAPVFGGYCAFAASRGYLAPTIPEAWTVYEGRLYLNANLRARELWLQDIPGNIAMGMKNWPGILG
ncbi:MAG: YHS domain-containing (seleno)protein, partial [Paracoccaceae bacterium]